MNSIVVSTREAVGAIALMLGQWWRSRPGRGSRTAPTGYDQREEEGDHGAAQRRADEKAAKLLLRTRTPVPVANTMPAKQAVPTPRPGRVHEVQLDVAGAPEGEAELAAAGHEHRREEEPKDRQAEDRHRLAPHRAPVKRPGCPGLA